MSNTDMEIGSPIRLWSGDQSLDSDAEAGHPKLSSTFPSVNSNLRFKETSVHIARQITLVPDHMSNHNKKEARICLAFICPITIKKRQVC